MLASKASSQPNPFRRMSGSGFFAGEPQEEALSRIDYLCEHGGGRCVISGPRGIGKTALLSQLARRIDLRGERCSITPLPADSSTHGLLTQIANSWGVPQSGDYSIDCFRCLEEHFAGWGIMNRPVWLLCDQNEVLSNEMARICNWLTSTAARHELRLMIIVSCRNENDQPTTRHDADLSLELWPWDSADCTRYVKQSLQSAELTATMFTSEAHAALYERSAGLPGPLAQLCEFSWLAAQAESEPSIGSDLVHAIADEMLGGSPRVVPLYEFSAGYGAW